MFRKFCIRKLEMSQLNLSKPSHAPCLTERQTVSLVMEAIVTVQTYEGLTETKATLNV